MIEELDPASPTGAAGRQAPALISVVVPCFNEEEVIEQTHQALVRVLSESGENFEIIFVDDGSTDQTLHLLKQLATRANGHAKVIALSRNFGHQFAASAGLDHASGDAVVLIDADLQDPPEVILEMIGRWREGFHVAYGRRTHRAAESRFKLITAKCFYRLLNYLSDTDIPPDTGDFRLMDRKVVAAVKAMPERDRFLRGMVSWVGFRQVAVPYQRQARAAGESKYPVKKMVKFALDGIFSFSTKPLRLATWLGVATSTLALLGICYAVVVRLFTDMWVSGWAFLVVAIFFMGGIQLLFLGVLGEYLSRVYQENKGRPLYLVAEKYGFDEGDQPGDDSEILGTSS